VAGVVDGAEWCQAFLDAHRPDAVRILDFPHAARGWAAVQRRELRDGAATRVLAAIRALPVNEAPDGALARQVQAAVLGYLEPRLPQMRYAVFRAQGLPIGSGIVESANKLVVEARLKGAGRRWAEANINPMLALRGAICSERWDEAWRAIARARRARRSDPASPMPMPAASAASVAAPAGRSRRPPSPTLPRQGPKRIVNGRPTAHHPWKRFAGGPPPAPAKL